MRWSWGGKSAGKAVCAAESLALSGPATWSLFPPGSAWQGCGGGCKRPLVPAGGGQASTHAPLSRVRPRLMRLRRLRAAVRCLSQALFLAVPR